MVDMYKGDRSDYWETPPEWRKWLINTFGVNIDVCANDANAMCESYFSEEKSCFSVDWPNEKNDICFMNPPFSMASKFIKFAVWQARKRNVKLILLYKANFETKVWQEDILPHAKYLFFPRKRIPYAMHGELMGHPPFTTVFALFNIQLGLKEYLECAQRGHVFVPHPEMLNLDALSR